MRLANVLSYLNTVARERELGIDSSIQSARAVARGLEGELGSLRHEWLIEIVPDGPSGWPSRCCACGSKLELGRPAFRTDTSWPGEVLACCGLDCLLRRP